MLVDNSEVGNITWKKSFGHIIINLDIRINLNITINLENHY